MAAAYGRQKRSAPKPDRMRPSKRVRLHTPPTSSIDCNASPIAQSEHHTSHVTLPTKVSESQELPVLHERQSTYLPLDEYQTIASSAVLQASLDRSRAQWTLHGVFERYWRKPETGRNAKAPHPGNPDVKMMKAKGPCRVRIEPHIFEAEMYIDEKNKPKTQAPAFATPHPYVPPQNMLGTTYRPAQTPQNVSLQGSHAAPSRGLPTTNHHASAARTHTPASHTFVSNAPKHPQQPVRPPVSKPPGTTISTTSKASPDPVISMLAERASADQSLKLLMKQVATGNASQDQLRIFQRHIDELTKIIQDRDKRNSNITPRSSLLPQLDGTNDTHPPHSIPKGTTAPVASSPSSSSPALGSTGPQNNLISPAVTYTQPQQWPLQSPALPVALQFTSVGASDDRFLFPQYSILESLSKQHTLVSFVVVRECNRIAESLKLASSTQFWQPVTMMVEVAYGREELLNHIRRWVKPADEVRRHMQDIMQRAQRAPDMHLAFRLPFKADFSSEAARQRVTVASDDRDGGEHGPPSVSASKKKVDTTNEAASLLPTKANGGDDATKIERDAESRSQNGARKSARIKDASH